MDQPSISKDIKPGIIENLIEGKFNVVILLSLYVLVVALGALSVSGAERERDAIFGALLLAMNLKK